jgi:hypothetical protein
MIHFPHNPFKRAAAALMNVRPASDRDILWNRPVFKAPALPIPAVAIEPLPRAERRPGRPVRN